MEDWVKLVARAREGDLEAYGLVVRRFQDMAYGYAYSVLGDFGLAEDAAQEAFVEAYQCLASLREPAAFPAWLRRIVLKHCDRITRRKRVATVPLESAAEIASGEAGPAEIVERRQMHDEVVAAIRALPEHEREVTALFYINGYSHEDIAGFLGVQSKTVKSRLHTARTRLRERMVHMVSDSLREHTLGEDFAKRVDEATRQWYEDACKAGAGEALRSESQALDDLIKNGPGEIPEWAMQVREAMPTWGFEMCSHRWLDGLDDVMEMIASERYRPSTAGRCGDKPGRVLLQAEQLAAAVELWVNGGRPVSMREKQVFTWLGETTPEKKQAATCFVELVRAWFFDTMENAQALSRRWRERIGERTQEQGGLLGRLLSGDGLHDGLDGGLDNRCGFLAVKRLEAYVRMIGGSESDLEATYWICLGQLRLVFQEDPDRMLVTRGYLWGLHAYLTGRDAAWLRENAPECAGAAIHALQQVSKPGPPTPVRQWLAAWLLSTTKFWYERALDMIAAEDAPDYARSCPEFAPLGQAK